METNWDILDKESKPWLILGNLDELSSLDEKRSSSKGNSTRFNNFIITIIILLI